MSRASETDATAEAVTGQPERARSTRKSPAERSAEIRRAARDLALAEGLVALTLRSVAAHAGVTPALVAHYEPSMETLVAETFGSIVAEEIDEIASLVAALPTPRQQLSALIATTLDGTRDDVTLVWVDSWSLGRRNVALATRVRHEMDSWQTVIVDIIDRGVELGEFTTDDPANVAWQLLGMIDGINSQALVRWQHERARDSLIGDAVAGMLGLDPGALAN